MFELEPVHTEVSQGVPDELSRTIKAVVNITNSSLGLHREGTTRRIAYTSYVNSTECVAYIAGYFGHEGFSEYTLDTRDGPLGVPVTAVSHNGVFTVILGEKPTDGDMPDMGINEQGLPYVSVTLSDETTNALLLTIED